MIRLPLMCMGSGMARTGYFDFMVQLTGQMGVLRSPTQKWMRFGTLSA